MNPEVAFYNSSNLWGYRKKFFAQILKAASIETGLGSRRIGLSVNLVSKSRIKFLNQNHRKINKSTDILSFPLQNLRISGFRPRQMAASPASGDSDIIELGDIFICPAFIQEEAERRNAPTREKMVFLTIHGFLHLLGYDHEKSAQEQKRMSNLESKIFNKLNKQASLV